MFQEWTGFAVAGAPFGGGWEPGWSGCCWRFPCCGRFYRRPHLDQVLCTFGLILVANEAVRTIWGPAARRADIPALLGGLGPSRAGAGLSAVPAWRSSLVGLVVAAGLWALVTRTRLGMLIRAGASDRVMVQALGVEYRRAVHPWFSHSAPCWQGLAGALLGPLLAIQPGMGEGVLILTLVVVVIGGIGSVRGAFVAALLVGLADTFGRVTDARRVRQHDRVCRDGGDPGLEAAGLAACPWLTWFRRAGCSCSPASPP